MASVAPTPGRIRLPVKDQRVEDLLLWRDPKTSGLAFGAATLVFCFFQFAKVNFLSLCLYALSTLVFALFLWRMVGGLLKRPPPALPKVLITGVDDAQVRSAVERLTPLANCTLAFVNRTLNGTEPLLSIIVAVGLYVAARVASRFPVLVLAYLPVLAAFTLPKVYEQKKVEIDGGIDALRTKGTEFYDKYLAAVVSRIPRATPASPASSSTTRKLD